LSTVQAGDDALAFELLGAAEVLRESIGSPRSDAQLEELEEQISADSTRLGARASLMKDRGRALALGEALDTAMRYANPETTG